MWFCCSIRNPYEFYKNLSVAGNVLHSKHMSFILQHPQKSVIDLSLTELDDLIVSLLRCIKQIQHMHNDGTVRPTSSTARMY